MRGVLILMLASMGFAAKAIGSESLAVTVHATVLPSTTVAVTDAAQAVFEISSDEKVAVSSYSLADAADMIVGKAVITPPSKSVEGKWKSRIEFSVTALNEGELEFPVLSLWYGDESGRSGAVQTRPLKFTAVNPVQGAAAPEMIRDIKPLFKETGLFWFWVALFALAVGGVIYSKFYRNRVSPDAPAAPSEPPRPPEEIALEKLELCYHQYQESRDYKLFYSEMSAILRTYLGEQYSLDTLEKTTSELFAEMRKAGIERKTALLTREILSSSDLVKFAKFVPDAVNISDEFERTKALVLETAGQKTSVNRSAS